MSRAVLLLVLLVSTAHALVHVFELSLPSVEQDLSQEYRPGDEAAQKQLSGRMAGAWRLPFGLGALVAGLLVDRLGGLAEAVEVAKELAGIAAERKAALVPFPAERDFFELWTEELLGVRAPALRRSIATVLRTLDAVAPVAERLAPLLEGGDQRLMAPEIN